MEIEPAGPVALKPAAEWRKSRNRDEAEAYAQRLREAGVPVESIRLEGMIHSVVQRGARIEAGDRLITWMARKLEAVTGVDTGVPFVAEDARNCVADDA